MPTTTQRFSAAAPQHPAIGGIGPAQPKFVPSLAQDSDDLPSLGAPSAVSCACHGGRAVDRPDCRRCWTALIGPR